MDASALRSFRAELEKLSEVPPTAEAYRTELKRLKRMGHLKRVKAVQKWTGSKDLAVIPKREKALAHLRGLSKLLYGKKVTASARSHLPEVLNGATGDTILDGGHLYAFKKLEKSRHGQRAAELFARERRNPNWAHKLVRNKQAIKAIHDGRYGADDLIRMASLLTKRGFVERPGFQHFTHGAELAGLGVLGVPSYKNLKNPKSTPKEKRHAKYELAGLGILGVPSALHLAHSAVKRFRG